MSPDKADFLHRAHEFLAVSSQFGLGELPTEQPHPLTQDLSRLAQSDLAEALRALHAVDRHALEILAHHARRVQTLARRVRATLETGRRIFLCGCGSTGRLSLTCETLWRRHHWGKGLHDRVVALMAGGDIALIQSIEHFEDRADYGRRQLLELGFSDGDLLVACTEGGETPFVIGATLTAAHVSSNSPFFLYCNPDKILCRVAERSAMVLHDRRIKKINLAVGPMALAGSTRMQASTVLMASVGFALMYHDDARAIPPAIESLAAYWNDLDVSFLTHFVTEESSCYSRRGFVEYDADEELAITILTDTTERAPTFSMHPFENALDPHAPPSLCCLSLPDAPDNRTAWEMLLARPPRTLEWEDIGGVASYERLLGFDFSRDLRQRRIRAIAGATQERFAIQNRGEHILLEMAGKKHSLNVAALPDLSCHLILKMLLNSHSTLVMGRLGRFEGNIMTWVRPTCNKLIDRAIRYAGHLLRKNGIEKTYKEIAFACFELMEHVPADQPLVYAIVEKLAPAQCDRKPGSA